MFSESFQQTQRKNIEKKCPKLPNENICRSYVRYMTRIRDRNTTIVNDDRRMLAEEKPKPSLGQQATQPFSFTHISRINYLYARETHLVNLFGWDYLMWPILDNFPSCWACQMWCAKYIVHKAKPDQLFQNAEREYQNENVSWAYALFCWRRMPFVFQIWHLLEKATQETPPDGETKTLYSLQHFHIIARDGISFMLPFLFFYRVWLMFQF